MASYRFVSSLLLASPLVSGLKLPLQERAGTTPGLPFDPATTPHCTWWIDHDGGKSCPDVLQSWGITLADFRRWNPSISASCEGLQSGKSYCVEAWGEPEPVSSSSTSSTATTTTTTATTTGKASSSTSSIRSASASSTTSSKLTASSNATTITTGNDIATPTPAQPGMIENCDLFYKVESGDTCQKIIDVNGLNLDQFLQWNTEVGGADCTNLWLGSHVCISIVGHTPSKPSSTRTSTITITTIVNGISTPTPTQPGMVGNCDAFYKVKTGDTCESIASANGITVAQFIGWNTQIGGQKCDGMWKDFYVCISTVGHTPSRSTISSTKTTPIVTPTPIQTGLTKSCKKFHYVATGQTCETIIKQYGITLAQFVSWNPDAGAKCTGLWANTWACVGV